MALKKVLPVVLAASITGEAALSVRHFDTLAPQPHIELNVTVPPSTTVSQAVSASGGVGPARSATMTLVPGDQSNL